LRRRANPDSTRPNPRKPRPPAASSRREAGAGLTPVVGRVDGAGAVGARTGVYVGATRTGVCVAVGLAVLVGAVVAVLVAVGLQVLVGAVVAVCVAVGLLVLVGVEVAADQHALETWLSSIVTAPLIASAPPCIRAPVVRVMLVSARIFPANPVLVPRVAELPTCQKTLQWLPP